MLSKANVAKEQQTVAKLHWLSWGWFCSAILPFPSIVVEFGSLVINILPAVETAASVVNLEQIF